MSRRLAPALAGAFLLLAAAPAAAEPAAKAGAAEVAPYRAMREVGALQDKVARGSAAAQAARPKALAHAAEVFAAAEPAVWKEPRNADAAALYLFSAGRASAVRNLIDRGVAFAPERDRLVKGALAYAEGQDDVARALLGPIDPKALPTALGGQLALVVATLFADKDPARADAMLDVARLLVPGTLVEEAALRRQIFLLAEPATLDRFADLSRQYVRRFRESVFAPNFEARLASFATRLAVGGDVAQVAKLDSVFGELGRDKRRAAYLALARDALVAGRPEVARYAAARAGALAPDPADAERAKLYTAAAAAASPDAAAARGFLQALDAARLPARDVELRDAALALAGAVDAGLGDRGQVVEGGDAPEGPTQILIERAKRDMAAGDAMLAVAVGPPPGVGAPVQPAGPRP